MQIPGTELASPITTGDDGVLYGTHYSYQGIGGYQEFLTIAQRNSIPVDNSNGLNADGLSSGRRRLMMKVFIYETQLEYQLQVLNWNTLTTTQRLAALGDNTNWKVVVSGVTYTQGLGVDPIDFATNKLSVDLSNYIVNKDVKLTSRIGSVNTNDNALE